MDSKLKCVFDLPSGDFGTQLNVSASSTASANTALIGSTQVSSVSSIPTRLLACLTNSYINFFTKHVSMYPHIVVM